MLQLFGCLALLLTSTHKAQEGIEITAESGTVVVQAANARLRAERLTYEPDKTAFKLRADRTPAKGSTHEPRKVEFEFRADCNLIIVQVDGWRVQAAKMRYNPAGGILACNGDGENKARLSIRKDGGWHLDREAKTISYFIGGAIGFED
jgi:hypothetical protein